MKLTDAEIARADYGSNGRLVKCWETHCVRCEHPALGLGYRGTTRDAAAELLREGWGVRQGYWMCPQCISAAARKAETPKGENDDA